MTLLNDKSKENTDNILRHLTLTNLGFLDIKQAGRVKEPPRHKLLNQISPSYENLHECDST